MKRIYSFNCIDAEQKYSLIHNPFFQQQHQHTQKHTLTKFQSINDHQNLAIYKITLNHRIVALALLLWLLAIAFQRSIRLFFVIAEHIIAIAGCIIADVHIVNIHFRWNRIEFFFGLFFFFKHEKNYQNGATATATGAATAKKRIFLKFGLFFFFFFLFFNFRFVCLLLLEKPKRKTRFATIKSQNPFALSRAEIVFVRKYRIRVNCWSDATHFQTCTQTRILIFHYLC